jgi:hypothetical protein
MLTENVFKRLRKRFYSVMDLVEFPFEVYSLGADGIVILDAYDSAYFEDAKNVILRDLDQSTLGRLYGLSFSDLLVHVPDEKTFFDSRAWEHYFLTPAGRVYLSELDGYVGPIYRD